MTEHTIEFEKLCGDAVAAFIQSVVVIDNEASLTADMHEEDAKPAAAEKKRASAPGGSKGRLPDSGNEAAGGASEKMQGSAKVSNNDHRLELNKVSQAFAEKGVTCGVYLPTEVDPANKEDLVNAAVKAIQPTDACILDWQLRKGDSGPAIDTIKKILEIDNDEGGRLRLILIYTAEKIEQASGLLNTALGESSFETELTDLENGIVITANHFRIVFINKPTRVSKLGDDLAVVQWDLLPERIISEFTILSQGLLRAFALQSVAAVRRDVHRILAQFNEELDPVYAGDRATKPDPDDASELVTEMLCSELNHTLTHSRSAQDCLTEYGLLAWVAKQEESSKFRNDSDVLTIGGVSFPGMNMSAREKLLSDREKRNEVWVNEKTAVKIRNSFFLTDADAKNASMKLAALSTLARVSTGVVIPPDEVRLRFGSVIRFIRDEEVEVEQNVDPVDSQGEINLARQDEVFLCLQPSCDTVRINGVRPFLLVKLVKDTEKFELLIPENKEFSCWRLPGKEERSLRTVEFGPTNDSKTVQASADVRDGSLYFEDSTGGKWVWLADLRDLTAVTMRDGALQPYSRVGVNSLEWLRLRGEKGK